MTDIAALTSLIAPEAESLGLALVRVAMFGGQGDPVLQVMAERPDTRQLDIADCEALSRRISDRLDGEWQPLPNATTFEQPFAGINNVKFANGVKPWTRDISHGELIRDGYDQTPTIDPNHLQLLFQGRDPAINTSYSQLPYRLGLLRLNSSGANPSPSSLSP